ncbi:hypothetical protein MTR_2g014310 [Medicago truncatula]|uniref:Uncharacterized protein n=1 Tax=Medicago truncatula TaxID=3880 RepID=G7ISE5_MEDTR|nr:hypothetical protein MTR_2g014310 [Medicago truncatula]
MVVNGKIGGDFCGDLMDSGCTSDTKIVKNVKGESANKLTTPKLIACNSKMATNNMIKPKLSKYSCFRICNVDVQIIG